MTKPEYTDEDMANVGRALMERLPDNYSYMNCPSEIVTDLQNVIADTKEDLRLARRDRDAACESLDKLGIAHDEQVDRLKACEHIADGDGGWEKLRDICPSAAAVARLRDETNRIGHWNVHVMEKANRAEAKIVELKAEIVGLRAYS